MSKQTTLLLVGRSGSGKSSVRNSILGKPALKASGMRQETTLSNEIDSNEEFFVVDCSGVGDTGSDMVGDVKDVICNARNALTGISEKESFEIVDPVSKQTDCLESSDGDFCFLSADSDTTPAILHVTEVTHSVNKDREKTSQKTENRSISEGFDVLIFVMKYGFRFTKQEKDAVQMVKSIFGENVFRDWGIIVFSYGDNFKLDTEDYEISFADWCNEQTGDIKLLFEEVQYRCVIFDNKSTNKEKEVESLKDNIDKVTKHGRLYTLSDFDNAKCGRVKLQLTYPSGGLQAETDHLSTRAIQLVEQTPLDHEQFQKLLDDLSRHVEKLISLDEGTGLLKPLSDHVIDQISTLERNLEQRDSSVEGRWFYETAWQLVLSFWQKLNYIRSLIASYFPSIRATTAPTQHTDNTKIYP